MDINNKDTNNHAFFDVDGTILRITSMKSFQVSYFQYAYKEKEEGLKELDKFKNKFKCYQEKGLSREYMNREYYRSFRDRSKSETVKIANAWWNDTLNQVKDLFIRETIERMEQHRGKKHKLVLVSGSFEEIVAPLADHLNVDHIIATNLEVKDGHYTGEIAGPQLIGEGKREAIRLYAKKNLINLSNCSAYGDHISDLPMLELVGNPFVVAGDAELDEIASNRGWGSIEVLHQA